MRLTEWEVQMTWPAPRWISSLLAITLAASPAVFAYESPLDSESIREAYFLGRRNDQKTVAFFDDYAKRLPMPDRGPYVSFIGLLTPYAQVAANSQSITGIYSAQQAEHDYDSYRDTIRVRVRIEFTATYTAVKDQEPAKDNSRTEGFVFRSPDFWRDFLFELYQEKGPIKPRDTKGVPIYDDNGFSGAEVSLEYDAKEVKSEDTSFEIITPDGQHIVAKFDLSKLR
jgi:hypothetical protein